MGKGTEQTSYVTEETQHTLLGENEAHNKIPSHRKQRRYQVYAEK